MPEAVRRSSATGATNCASNWSSRHGEETGPRSWPTATAAPCPPATSRKCQSPASPPTDVEQLGRADRADNDLRLSLYRSRRKDGGLRFKLYRQLNDDIPLSDALPMMENMGLRVISEHPYQGRWPTAGLAYIQDFEVESLSAATSNVDAISTIDFEDAFARRSGAANAENDGFNRLILTAGSVVAAGRDAAQPTASTSCRWAFRSRRPTCRSDAWRVTRCWRACWWNCSRRASIQRTGSESDAEIKSRRGVVSVRQLKSLSGRHDEAAMNALKSVVEARDRRRVREARDPGGCDAPTRCKGPDGSRVQPR